MEQLERLTVRLGEGLAERRAQERLELSSDELSFVREDQALEMFNVLLLKYYELVARLALAGCEKEKIEALMKVAWTSVEACASALEEAFRKGKTITEMDLIVLRYEHQLNALDPDHPFVPVQHFRDA